jgi:hypothetical protein
MSGTESSFLPLSSESRVILVLGLSVQLGTQREEERAYLVVLVTLGGVRKTYIVARISSSGTATVKIETSKMRASCRGATRIVVYSSEPRPVSQSKRLGSRSHLNLLISSVPSTKNARKASVTP